MSNVIIQLLVFTCFGLRIARGDFLCYSCVMDGASTDLSCLNNPAGVTTSNPVVKCPYKYCTIIRQEYVDPAGQIYTFYRGCTPYDEEGVLEGGGFKVYTRVCTSNLCNNWDGIATGPSGGSGGSGGGGGGSGGGGGGSGIGDPGYNGILNVRGTGGTGSQRGGLCAVLIATIMLMNIFV